MKLILTYAVIGFSLLGYAYYDINLKSEEFFDQVDEFLQQQKDNDIYQIKQAKLQSAIFQDISKEMAKK